MRRQKASVRAGQTATFATVWAIAAVASLAGYRLAGSTGPVWIMPVAATAVTVLLMVGFRAVTAVMDRRRFRGIPAEYRRK